MATLRHAGLAVEHRHLPAGDALWVARSVRDPGVEFVLDFLVERKSCQDLVQSIRSSRYKSQKARGAGAAPPCCGRELLPPGRRCFEGAAAPLVLYAEHAAASPRKALHNLVHP